MTFVEMGDRKWEIVETTAPSQAPLVGRTARAISYFQFPTSALLFVLRELLLVADGELPTSLGAAALQNSPPTLAGHAGQEAVLAQARDSLRLIGSLGHGLRAPVARLAERSLGSCWYRAPMVTKTRRCDVAAAAWKFTKVAP